MTSTNQSLHYQVYLLRFWGEAKPAAADASVWRFSLEDPRTGKRHGFADFQALSAFLADRMGEEQLQANQDKQRKLVYLR